MEEIKSDIKILMNGAATIDILSLIFLASGYILKNTSLIWAGFWFSLFIPIVGTLINIWIHRRLGTMVSSNELPIEPVDMKISRVATSTLFFITSLVSGPVFIIALLYHVHWVFCLLFFVAGRFLFGLNEQYTKAIVRRIVSTHRQELFELESRS